MLGVCIYICMQTSIFMQADMHEYVGMYICMYVGSREMYKYIHMHICASYMYVHMDIGNHMYICKQTCISLYMLCI